MRRGCGGQEKDTFRGPDKTTGTKNMAKILFTAIIADIRKSLAGTTFARNRAGAYMRTKTTPVNPQTPFQENRRLILANLTSAWRTLEQEQREAWNAAVVDKPQPDGFGGTFFLTGHQLFMSVNMNLATVGQSLSETPPEFGLLLDNPITSFTSNGTATFNVTVTDTVATNWAAIVQATAPLSLGKFYAKNLFRQIAIVASGSPAPFVLGPQYIAKFGSLSTGKSYQVKVYYINTLTGQATSISTARVEVAAG